MHRLSTVGFALAISLLGACSSDSKGSNGDVAGGGSDAAGTAGSQAGSDTTTSGGIYAEGGGAEVAGEVGNGGSPGNGGNTGRGGQTGNGGTIGNGGEVGRGGLSEVGGTGSGGRTGNGGAPELGGETSLGGSGEGGTPELGGEAGNGGAAELGGETSLGGSGEGGTPELGGEAGSGGEAGTPSATWWKPAAGLTWQWQISGGVIDPALDVDVFDIDWEEDSTVVQELHDAGKKVICYVSVGSWEDWRPDAGDFPAEVLGNDYEGWPGERFVDIRAQSLRQIMAARLKVCQEKGFDGVEPDNMDVFSSDSGFPLTEQDGIDYANWLAEECHARGMSIGQKNASELTTVLQPTYDWALTESCYSDGDWCEEMSAYVENDKPVFMCEYEADSFADACAWALPLGYSPILKELELGAPVEFCP